MSLIGFCRARATKSAATPSCSTPAASAFGDEAADRIDMGAEGLRAHVPHPDLAPVVFLADVQHRAWNGRSRRDFANWPGRPGSRALETIWVTTATWPSFIRLGP